MQTAAHNTVQTADEIKAVEQVARRGADAAGEIQRWTERLSARAVALESKVATSSSACGPNNRRARAHPAPSRKRA